MEHDDEVGDSQPGPRRSTFTPPTSPQPVMPAAASETDDDALADALAADLSRIASGPITVITPDTVIPPGPAMAAPAQPVSWQPPLDVAPSVPTTPAPAPEAEAVAPAAEPPSPAWSSFPAPDPAQAVPLAEGPPVRKSMADDELSRWVADATEKPGGTLDVIEQLQNQMKLREEEAREFRAWEDRMRSLSTPDALGAVDDARQQFSGVLPDAPAAPATGSFMLPENPVADWPVPDFTAPTGPAPVVDPTPAAPEPVPSPSLPAWDVPAPSATWAPPPEWDQQEAAPTPPPLISPEALAQAPAPEAATRAPFDWTPQTAPVGFIPPVVTPAPLVEPSAAPAPPTLPAVDPVVDTPAEPVADTDDVVVPTIEPDTDAVEEVQVEPQPELTVEPLPDAPPPLIEPGAFGGPSLVPSPVTPLVPNSFEAALAGPPASDDDDDEDDDPEPGSRAFDWTMPGPSRAASTGAALSFDSLLAEAPEVEEPLLHADPEPADPAPEALFIEPMPVAAGEGVPTETGSITVVDQAYDEELDDDVDETDRAFDGILGPVSVDTSGIAAVGSQISPPSGPISTVRIRADEQVLFDDEPVALPVFSIEESDIEPTPVDHRVGRAARLFWLWFAANSSILSVGLGAAVFAVGMSLRQSIVAILAGVALSFLPLGLTTLAGKRSGQPTMIVSRATFGLYGNVIPAIVALISRVFWGAVLLWLLASSVAVVLVGAQLDGSLGERQILLISLAAAFLIAVLVAFAGYPLFARIQLILSIVSGILVVGLIVMTYQYIDIPNALTAADGPWLLTITGAVLVFSFVGLVWANSGADLARYQRPDSSGASSMLWATFGTTVPTFLLIAYGALLAASDKGIASGFLLSPLDTLALMLPSWYPVPLVAATALSLLSGIILSLYSGGFALQSVGVRVKRQWSIVIVGVLLGGLSLLLGFGITGGLNEVLRDVATTLAVPTAAWAGIFAAETMIRNRRFESQSLVKRGGVYADVRWVNLLGLLVFSAVGYGFTTAAVTWLSWQGYGFGLIGVGLDTDLAGTDVGVLVALVLGLLLPIVAGIPAIRKQEAMRV